MKTNSNQADIPKLNGDNLQDYLYLMSIELPRTYPFIRRLINYDETKPVDDVIGARVQFNEFYMSELQLMIPAPDAIPQTLAEIEAYRLRLPIAEDLRKRKAAHLEPSVGAINMILATIEKPIVAKLRQNDSFRRAEIGNDLYGVWTAIPIALEVQGAPALFQKAEAYQAYLSARMTQEESISAYNERWRTLRARSNALGNVEQPELDLAHRYIVSLNHLYMSFLNSSSQRAIPFAALSEAMSAAAAWKTDYPPSPPIDIGAATFGDNPVTAVASSTTVPSSNAGTNGRQQGTKRANRRRREKRQGAETQGPKPVIFPKVKWKKLQPNVQEAVKITNEAIRAANREGAANMVEREEDEFSI
jgi:hypothetical protein